MMLRIFAGIGFICVLLTVVIIFAGISTPPTQSKFANKTAFSDEAQVKVLANQDAHHGSAVYIGNGRFVTAAHVLRKENKPYRIKTTTGRIYEAEVLWANTDYDIGVLFVKDPKIKAAPIDCAESPIRLPVIARGNPYEMEVIETTGYVASKPTSMYDTSWKEAVIYDISAGPGMSGGGIFNYNNELVGITVGMRMYNTMGVPSPSGFTIGVPSKTLCRLIGIK